MEPGLFFLLGVLVAWTALKAYTVYRRRGLTLEGWSEMRQLVYQAIDQALAVYEQAQTGIEALVNTVIEIIWLELENSNLPQEDRRFWTQENIRAVVQPVLRQIFADKGWPERVVTL